MKPSPLWISLALSTPCLAQVASEDFSTANTSNWGVEFTTPATWYGHGGNPDGMIAVSITNSQLIPVAMVVPAAPGHPWVGNFAAMDVSSFSYDRQLQSAISVFGTNINLVLGNDNGTPTDMTDDTLVFTPTGDSFQFGALPWTTFNIAIPSSETTIPAGWNGGAFFRSPVAGTAENTMWDLVIHDVDYVGLAMDRSIGGAFWFGTHILNFDNFILNVAGGVGTPFCNPANSNSSGNSTTLSASFLTGGGIAGGMSDLHLECAYGVPNELGYFLVGSTASAPGISISNGMMCLSSPDIS